MRLFKTLLLAVTGFLLMGNQSCQQQPVLTAPKARELKYIVDVGLVKSAMIDMPGGEKFDFEFVLNQQMYPVLQKSEGFWFRYKPPFNDTSSQLGSNIELRNLNLAKNDMALLEHSFAGKVIPPSIKSDEISCLVNLPQYRLWGTVNSFELMSKIGLGLGFTPSGGISAGGMIGVNFEVDTYQLDMNLVAGHPITLGVEAATNVTAKQTRTQLGFKLPIYNLMIDPSYYHQTPLARVSYSALETAVKQVQQQLKDKKAEWNTRVLYADEHVATILAGNGHNVQKGDVFNVYNERTFWGSKNGENPIPCESQYLGSIDGEPIAKIEIFDVSDEISVGKVVWDSGIPMKMGAKVKIAKLIEPITMASPTTATTTSQNSKLSTNKQGNSAR